MMPGRGSKNSCPGPENSATPTLHQWQGFRRCSYYELSTRLWVLTLPSTLSTSDKHGMILRDDRHVHQHWLSWSKTDMLRTLFQWISMVHALSFQVVKAPCLDRKHSPFLFSLAVRHKEIFSQVGSTTLSIFPSNSRFFWVLNSDAERNVCPCSTRSFKSYSTSTRTLISCRFSSWYSDLMILAVLQML